jgi:ankyrin repeat domain-containing protein 50
MLKGFGSNGYVQLYWEVCENNYLRSVHQENYQGLIEPLAKLYSQIIEYQARVICHFSKAQLSRAWENVAGSNDWDGIAKEIEKVSEKCSEFIPHLKEEEIRERWKRQLQEMQESRAILDKIRQILQENGTQSRKIYEDQRERELLQDLASDYNGDKNFNPPRVNGTCEWFFTDSQFHQWRDGSTSGLLWVTAGPGCGKSVLSRALIDERRLSTNATTSTICHFFFRDGDEGRMYSHNALCAILHQLFTQDLTGNLIEKALASHKNFGKHLTENISELWQILVHCVRSSDAGEVICILDALDECNAKSRQTLIGQLNDFYSQPSYPSKLKFLITGRPYPDLEAAFQRFSGVAAYLHTDGDSDAKSEKISREINLVIDARLHEITLNFEDEDRLEISKALKDMKNRTYLWLYLTFDAIEQSACGSRSDVTDLLSTLPNEVSDRYERMLKRSPDQTRTEILLSIVLAAVEPLSLDEANVALTLASHKEQLRSYAALKKVSWPRGNFISMVKKLCGLFISIQDSQLFFIHKTARDFLVHSQRQGKWKGCLTMPASHSTILRSCLHYLVLPDIETPDQNDATTNVLKDTFLDYAAENWHFHYTSQQSRDGGAGSEKEVMALVLELCDPRSKPYQAWSAIYASTSWVFPRSASPLIIASYFGFEAVVKHLISTGKVDVNCQDEEGRTPLSYAASDGDEGVVKQLLDTGKVDVNCQDKNSRTPLSYAASRGYEGVVKQLLDTGNVDVNCQDKNSRTPLSYAASDGDEGVVKQLLDTGNVDVNCQDKNSRTPLSYAASDGHEAVVKQLLDTGKADVNCQDEDGRTPLSYVASRGYEAVMKQLLDIGNANVNCQDKISRTPLSYAASRGYEGVVKQLLDTGNVDVDRQDQRGRTPLSYAASRGHEAVVKQLLDTGKVDVDRQDKRGRTPLLCAAVHGHEAVVKQLLDTGKVDIDRQDKRGRTPLSYAAVHGHEAVVKQLLDIGNVDVDCQDQGGRTPLSYAASRGHEAVVKQLLDTGNVDVDCQDQGGRTPLSYAASRGHEAVVKQLLDTGNVDVDRQDQRGRTPLSYAASRGHEAVVKQLLDTGKVNVDLENENGDSALSLAGKRGHETINQQLKSYQASQLATAPGSASLEPAGPP